MVPGVLSLTATVNGPGADFNPLNNQAMELTVAVPDDRPPVIIGQRLRIARQKIAGVQLTFNEPMDPILAGDVRNYRIAKPSGAEVPAGSATYDAVAQTVTLVPRRPLSVGVFYELSANGVGAPGLTDTNGVVLDGDLNGLPDGIYTSLIGRGTAHRPRRLQRGPQGDAPPARLRAPRPRLAASSQPDAARVTEATFNAVLHRRFTTS